MNRKAPMLDGEMGTTDAREGVMARLALELRQLANRSARDAELRKDLFQDMMARAWASLPASVSPRDAAAARVAAETALKDHRLRARRDRLLRVDTHDDDGVPAAADDPEAACMRREAMHAFFDGCEVADRRLVLLSLSGLSTAEIHGLTGVPKGTVTARIERTLRTCAKRHGGHRSRVTHASGAQSRSTRAFAKSRVPSVPPRSRVFCPSSSALL